MVRRQTGTAVVLLLLLPLLARAQSVSQLKPTDYVSDYAKVLNADTIAQIDNIAKQVDDKAHAQIALVTINTLDGQDIESYAADLFQKWGVGNKETNRGVLILYAIQDHRARIEVGYGLEPILPDGKVGGFQREAIPMMRSGDYNSALLLVVTRVAETIAQDAGVSLTGAPERAPPEYRPAPTDSDHGWSSGEIIGAIVIFVLIMVTPLRSLFFWLLFNVLLSGGRSSWGGGGGWGGGSGGFGGGGGFGGFGGGSSGGGGASSSW